MGSDVSRERFDALRDFSSVRLQQGRLLLDADWNELVAVVDRRLRANAADLGSTGPQPGTAGVAVVPRTTPDGFRIDATAGALTIGIGRMYVDGLLAENHGLPDLTFDPLLAEQVGTKKTPYDDQPYWPTPATLPAGGTHLAYLDVWDREVTPLEAPDLVESAVGVDTSTRTQTVWQVRLLAQDAGNAGCATPDRDVPGWLDVITPSAGRLTTGTVPVEDDEDPCELPPSGGYRGLENQTYRVEIHNGGAAGTATFKWSRDNGSIASPVVEVVSTTRVRPASLGRDSVLRFRTGDWVEILDDHRELDQQPGEMRRIQAHDEDGTISWTGPLPADLTMTTAQAAERHLRVRRWDQSGAVKTTTGTTVVDLDLPAATGVVPVPAGTPTMVLEHGVTVLLRAPGGTFRPGDHWVFAARTADTSVEELVDARPRGIHHHYARLAFVTFPGSETDCRTLWPPLPTGGGETCGDCTVSVTPESHAAGTPDIQTAIDLVTGTGGTVCLAPGIYNLDEGGVRITGATSVTLRGQGPRTLLLARGPAVSVERSAFIRLEDFAVVSAGGGAAVRMRTTAAVTAQRLTLVVVSRERAGAAGIELGGISLVTRLLDNAVLAPVGVRGGDADKTSLLTADLEVAGNLLVCPTSGVALAGRAAHMLSNVVRDNTVLRADSGGIRLPGLVAPGGSFTVAGNAAAVGGTGVEISGSGFAVHDNDVTGTPQSLQIRGDGIAVNPGTFGEIRGLTRITGNHVRDVGGNGVAVRTPVADLEVSHNVVERARQGIVVEERGRSASMALVGNVVRDIASRQSDGGTGLVGIQVVGTERANVDGNAVVGLATAREAGDLPAGVRVLAAVESRVAGNSVDRVGFDDAPGESVGIQVAGFFRRTLIDGNFSRRTPDDVDLAPVAPWVGLQIGTRAVDGGGPSHHGGYVAVSGEVHYVVGSKAVFAMARSTDVSAVVEANTVTGGGRAPAALLVLAGEAVVSSNQFRMSLESEVPTLLLVATAATVSANRARGGGPSMRLDVPEGRLAVLGNLTSRGIDAPNGFDPAMAPLNPDGIF